MHHQRKCFIFLFFFSLLPVFSQTVSAQKEIRKQASSGESYLLTPANFISSPGGVDERFDTTGTIETPDIKYNFHPIESKKRHLALDGLTGDGFEKDSLQSKHSTALLPADAPDDEQYLRDTAPGRGFNYGGAFKQSLLFLGVQHGYAILGQAKTRRALKHGAFFRDYVNSVKSLHGWDDGGRFFTNYLAHPMQGALTGHIYVQNSPQALREKFSMSPQYWKTRMKAFLWTAAWSTQFEIGPVSQASIGNVGLKGKQTYEDIVVTPIAGTAMLIAEDALDRYVIERIERNNKNFYVKVFARMLLNPTRNFSNMLRFKAPWYRDRPPAR